MIQDSELRFLFLVYQSFVQHTHTFFLICLQLTYLAIAIASAHRK